MNPSVSAKTASSSCGSPPCNITRQIISFSAPSLKCRPNSKNGIKVGHRLGFDPADVFDNGQLHGGYTLRLARQNLPEAERESYDSYVGVSVYEALPI